LAGRITIGDFVAFGFYLTLLVWPMIALGWVVNLYQRGAASMGRLNGILKGEPAEATPARPTSPEGSRGEVSIEHAEFAYPGAAGEVLRDVDFTVPSGTTVALVGPAGAGKSTLIALLARLYDPTAGRVLVDGIPLTEVDPADLRARIGMVPQDAFLFSDTIAANIGLGVPDDEARIEEAARVAQLDDQIREFPRCYDSLLGEGGINLSGGQKQRATLARALARDPTILVLDDALSAVDTHTEAKILTDLRSVTSRRTTFIISHRVSAVMHADMILVLEDG